MTSGGVAAVEEPERLAIEQRQLWPALVAVRRLAWPVIQVEL